jgi:hypothetical protein
VIRDPSRRYCAAARDLVFTVFTGEACLRIN